MDECPICGSWKPTRFLDETNIDGDWIELIYRCECKECHTKFEIKAWFKLTEYEIEVEEN